MTPQRRLIAGASLACAATPVYGQGCAQCRDNLRNMPPRTQSAYRQAIGLLLAVALLILAATAVIARKLR